MTRPCNNQPQKKKKKKKKEKLPISGLCSTGCITKKKIKESEKKDKYLDLARELKKNVEKLGDEKNTFRIFDQNTEKSSGDLRRLAVTQTPVRNHRLTLV